MIKFEGQAILSKQELDALGIEHDNGWGVGSWVDEHWIIGEIIEVTDEYIQPEFWVKVNPKTVQQIDLFDTLKQSQDANVESDGMDSSKEIEKIKHFIQTKPDYKVSDIQRLLMKGYKHCYQLLEEIGER